MGREYQSWALTSQHSDPRKGSSTSQVLPGFISDIIAGWRERRHEMVGVERGMVDRRAEAVMCVDGGDWGEEGGNGVREGMLLFG